MLCWDSEVQRAHPEDGPSQVLSSRIAASRVPVDHAFLQFVLAPSEKWLAASLTDREPVTSGRCRPRAARSAKSPNLGERPILIARRISWSPDSKFIYAAVAETDADIVLLDGLLR